jgi:hypothetical protein
MTRDTSILSVASLLVLPLAFALGCAVETGIRTAAFITGRGTHAEH